ncbi:MAG TPA: glycosyltransferase, partial [Candidatus Merdenecus merdavium]|nr:glycosyltransferase [Candidatus Merdenecus merdavium]
GQTYPYWELCLADGSGENHDMESILKPYLERDSRIKYKKLNKNLGIAGNTNAALTMSTGEYIGLLDHDDYLEIDCLYEVAKALEESSSKGMTSEIDILYTDEDKVREGVFFQPHFKPDFNLDLLRSNNYICHFFVVRREIAINCKGFSKEFDGAQDYDFIFRCIEQAKRIVHIPKILYHWRVHQESTADNPHSKLYAFQAGKRAIEGNLERKGLSFATVVPMKDLGFYRVIYGLDAKKMQDLKLSIIIVSKKPTSSLSGLLSQLRSIQVPHEIVVISSYDKEDDHNVIAYKKPFHFGAMANEAAKKSNGNLLLFLSDDVYKIEIHAMNNMIGNAIREDVGVVGGRSYDHHHRLIQAGLLGDPKKIERKLFQGTKKGFTGYLHKIILQQQVQAVSQDCLLIDAAKFRQAKGFNEELSEHFFGLELCLKTNRLGYSTIYQPDVMVFKKTDIEEEKIPSIKDMEYMQKHYSDDLKKGSSYYHEYLHLDDWTL